MPLLQQGYIEKLPLLMFYKLHLQPFQLNIALLQSTFYGVVELYHYLLNSLLKIQFTLNFVSVRKHVPLLKVCL